MNIQDPVQQTFAKRINIYWIEKYFPILLSKYLSLLDKVDITLLYKVIISINQNK